MQNTPKTHRAIGEIGPRVVCGGAIAVPDIPKFFMDMGHIKQAEASSASRAHS
jgi:hypothetical protein